MVQTSSRKQWNLVALNFNGLVAWISPLFKIIIWIVNGLG
jgi:hypothetical protein